MFCTKCGKSNDDNAKFCAGCGTALGSGTAAREVSAEECYETFVGSGSAYYLSRFQHFDRDGKPGATWHWPAFFFTFFWFLYRKLYLHALLYFILPYALLIPVGIIIGVMGDSAGAIIGLGYLAYLGAIFFVPGMYANSMYYKHCKKQIAECMRGKRSVDKQLSALALRGGTSVVGIVICLLLVVPATGILAAIALPAYQDYTVRGKMAAVSIYGLHATGAVSNYYQAHNRLPVTLAEAGYLDPLPPGVGGATVNQTSGAITITMNIPPIKGKSLDFAPGRDAQQNVVWQCGSADIPQRLLPRSCRSMAGKSQ